MPYASDAQRRYMHWAEEHGKIKKSTVDEYDQASKGKKLPERVGKGNDMKKAAYDPKEPDADDKGKRKVGSGKAGGAVPPQFLKGKGKGNPFQAKGPGVAPAIEASKNAAAAAKPKGKMPPQFLKKGK